MHRLVVLLLTLLVFAPRPALAQEPTSPAQRLETVRRRALEAGIPVELIDNRIAEGRAKGVPDVRIAEVVERRAADLVRAREVIAAAGVAPRPEDLSMGADAIEAGADGAAIRAVVRAARAEDRPVALAVLGELVRQGLPVQNARDRVTAALQGNGARLVDLPTQAAAERGRGPAAGRPANPGNGRGPGARNGGGGPPSSVPASGRPGGGRPDGAGGGRPDGPGGGPNGPGGGPPNGPGGGGPPGRGR